jgi:hypothetical protein
MAIDAKCPFCDKGYKLKDDLLGKKVTCANQHCRKLFTVEPSAYGVLHTATAGPSKPAPKIDAEELAAAALNDDPDDVPEDQKTIAMVCTMCEHPWTVSWAMQGKNVLCPDCKHRQKVPLQEKGKKGGWRERNVPEGVKQEVLSDVTSARDNKLVSGETLRATGVIKEDFEPLPTSVYVKWAALIGVPVLAVAIGLVFYLKSRTRGREEQEVVNWQTALDAEELKPLPLYGAALRIALGEFEARQGKDQKDRDKAIEYFTGALANLSTAPRTTDREQLYGELASSVLLLGGDGADVLDKRRINWLPQPPVARAQVKPNPAELEGVQGQLRRILTGLRDTRADFDTRTALARRLARELVARDQVDVIRSNLPALFAEPEQYEAEAQIGLECLRGRKTDLAKEIGEKLKKALAAPNPPPEPVPASAVALWVLLEIKGGPAIVPAPGAGEPSPASRWAYTAIHSIRKNETELMALLARAGKADARVKAFALAAEWTEPPGQVVDAAERAVRDEVSRRDPNTSLSGSSLLRLAQISARAGAADKAETFVKAILDDHLKAFAKAEVLRNRLAFDRGQQAKDEDAPIPDDLDPKKLKLGPAWGRLALARHNAARTRDKNLGASYGKNWPRAVIAPFGQAGALLGLQDNEFR